jgi:hypothetical protein
MMELQVHQAERLLYVLRVFGGHLEQAAAVSPESAHRTDVFRWTEAGLQQSYRVQILNPLTVGPSGWSVVASGRLRSSVAAVTRSAAIASLSESGLVV